MAEYLSQDGSHGDTINSAETSVSHRVAELDAERQLIEQERLLLEARTNERERKEVEKALIKEKIAMESLSFGDAEFVFRSDYPRGYGLDYLFQTSPFGSSVTYSHATDRQQGRNWPFVLTEQDVAYARGMSRYVTTMFSPGVSIGEMLKSHIIGKGGNYSAQKRKGRKPKKSELEPNDLFESGGQDVESLVSEVQDVIDEFLDVNKVVGDGEQEWFWRGHRDGDLFIALTPTRGELDGICDAREAEPEYVRDPGQSLWTERELERHFGVSTQYASNFTFGVHKWDHDPQRVLGYAINWEGTNFDYYPERLVEHLKVNVDRNVARGITDFFPAWRWLRHYDSMADNTVEGARQRAAIAKIVQHSTGVTKNQVQSMRQDQGDFRLEYRGSATGNTKTIDRELYLPGSTVDLPKGQEWVAGFRTEPAPSYIEVVKMIGHLLEVRWALPSGSLTGYDAEGSFSARVISGSRFFKFADMRQGRFASFMASVLWKVLRVALQRGRFERWGFGPNGKSWRRLKRVVELLINFPDIDTKDPMAAAQTRNLEVQSGLKSKRTAREEGGMDHDTESENIKEEQSEMGMPGAPGMMPGAPGPPGAAGAPPTPEMVPYKTPSGGTAFRRRPGLGTPESRLSDLSQRGRRSNGNVVHEQWTAFTADDGTLGARNAASGEERFGTDAWWVLNPQLEQNVPARFRPGSGQVLEQGGSEDWVEWIGPRGGRGWQSLLTGKVVYQDARPGEHQHEEGESPTDVLAAEKTFTSVSSGDQFVLADRLPSDLDASDARMLFDIVPGSEWEALRDTASQLRPEAADEIAAAYDAAKGELESANPGGIASAEAEISRRFSDQLDILHLSEDDRSIKLDHVRVKPEHRGQGVGGQVLRALKEYAQKVGKPIVLTAQPDAGKKTALNRFYRSHGFKKPGRSRDYALPRHTHIWRPTAHESWQPFQTRNWTQGAVDSATGDRLYGADAERALNHGEGGMFDWIDQLGDPSSSIPMRPKRHRLPEQLPDDLGELQGHLDKLSGNSAAGRADLNRVWNKIREVKKANRPQYGPDKLAEKQANLADPDRSVSFTGPAIAKGMELNGIALEPWDPPADWTQVEGTNPSIDEPEFNEVVGQTQFEDPKTGETKTRQIKKKRSAGVVIVEPDGRVWLFSPRGGFGGVDNSFPKGRLEGLDPQQAAIKEAYEETGLKVEIVSHIGDYERSTTNTRYYLARRTGGMPGDFHWESEAVRLVTPEAAAKVLNLPLDQDILDDALDKHHGDVNESVAELHVSIDDLVAPERSRLDIIESEIGRIKREKRLTDAETERVIARFLSHV